MKSKILIAFFLSIFTFNANAQTAKDSLYVFVGKKISVTYVREPQPKDSIMPSGAVVTYSSFYLKYKAVYEIIQNVYNNYKKDTIEFFVYDHEGLMSFSRYDVVLQAVRNHNGTLLQERNVFYDVYPAKNGCWASPGNPYRYFRNQKEKQRLKFKKFIKPVEVDNKKRLFEFRSNDNYIEPYYYTDGDKLVAFNGVCVDQLFSIWKEVWLKQYFN